MNTNEVSITLQDMDNICKKEIIEYVNNHDIKIDYTLKYFSGIDVIQITASIATMIQFIDWLILKIKKNNNITITYHSESEDFERVTIEQAREILDNEKNE